MWLNLQFQHQDKILPIFQQTTFRKTAHYISQPLREPVTSAGISQLLFGKAEKISPRAKNFLPRVRSHICLLKYGNYFSLSINNTQAASTSARECSVNIFPTISAPIRRSQHLSASTDSGPPIGRRPGWKRRSIPVLLAIFRNTTNAVVHHLPPSIRVTASGASGHTRNRLVSGNSSNYSLRWPRLLLPPMWWTLWCPGRAAIFPRPSFSIWGRNRTDERPPRRSTNSKWKHISGSKPAGITGQTWGRPWESRTSRCYTVVTRGWRWPLQPAQTK